MRAKRASASGTDRGEAEPESTRSPQARCPADCPRKCGRLLRYAASLLLPCSARLSKRRFARCRPTEHREVGRREWGLGRGNLGPLVHSPQFRRTSAPKATTSGRLRPSRHAGGRGVSVRHGPQRSGAREHAVAAGEAPAATIVACLGFAENRRPLPAFFLRCDLPIDSGFRIAATTPSAFGPKRRSGVRGGTAPYGKPTATRPAGEWVA